MRDAFSGQNVYSTKRTNRSTILQALLRWGPLSRVDLARRTGLSPGTITNIVTELRERGIVEEVADDPISAERVGRTAILIDLVPRSACVIAVHLSATEIAVGLVNAVGHGFGEVVHLPLDGDPSKVMSEITRVIKAMRAQLPDHSVIGIGVGSVGMVDVASGVNRFAPLLGWENTPIQHALEESCGLRVMVDNNVRAMALGEKMFGIGREVSNLLFTYVGIGLGSGLIVNGEPHRGHRNATGEFGHMTVVPNGSECWCGNKGCLEAYVSERSLRRQLGAAPSESLDSILSSQSARLDQVLRDQGAMLGVALANLHNVLDPDLMVLGGRLAQDERFFGAAKDELRARAFGARLNDIRLSRTSLGQEVGLIGAAAMVLKQYFYTWTEQAKTSSHGERLR